MIVFISGCVVGSYWMISVCKAPGKELQYVSVVTDGNSQYYPDNEETTLPPETIPTTLSKSSDPLGYEDISVY